MNTPIRIVAGSLLASCLVVGAVVDVGAATLQVPAQHATLGAALQAAAAGDTVLVAPGHYKEKLEIKPGVTLRSRGGPDSTSIDSPTLTGDALKERLVVVGAGADRSTVIEGFTLQGSVLMGTGIYCEHASPTIRGNVIRAFGWGISLRSSDALIEDNVIERCQPFGILIFASSPEVRRNTLHDNVPQAICVAGRKSKPIIGGRREDANRIFENPCAILLDSRNDVNAQGNDWGWTTTSEMERAGYPADITAFVDGNDRGVSARGKGKIDYRNWIRPTEREVAEHAAPASAGHDTLASPAAPGSPPPAGPATAGGEPARPAGMRWLVPALFALGLIAVFVIVSRRRSS